MPVTIISSEADCTPSKTLAANSCLSCLSESELDKVFVVALAESEGTYDLPTDSAQLIQDAACFTCLSDKQLKQALVSSYLESLSPKLTLDEIREKLKCLQCANPKQVLAATVYLTCKSVSR